MMPPVNALPSFRLLRPGLGCAVASILWVAASFALAAPPDQLSEARGHHGVVVSVSPHATDIGVAILRQGGNAVDAAIAVEFALAVTWPEAGNIGGGGFMMVHPVDGREPVCIDYRECAPKSATRDMFKPDDGRYTHKIVGVPGTVRGMDVAHQRFGSLPWRALVEPAARLAGDGFVVNAALAESLNEAFEEKAIREGEHHRELVRVYGRRDARTGELAPWQTGDRIVLPDLAATLRRIEEQGAAGFYEGPTARQLVAEMRRGNGLIGLEDLRDYRAKVRPPIHGVFRGHDIYGPPPPSSGGIGLIEMLQVLETFDLRSQHRFAPGTLHLMAESMKRAFRDRAEFLGDTDFVPAHPELLSREHALALARGIDPKKATPSETLAGPIRLADEPPQTTHFSVVDAKGMAVANTTTLEGSWGAHIVVRGAGFVLNNEMGDFNWVPGWTDREGRIGTPPNLIEPGKRMLSSQTPVIVATNGRPVLVTGSPGGRTIINTALQIVLDVVEFGMDLPVAMRSPRIHHQWFPDTLQVEMFDWRLNEVTLESLRAMGHHVTPRKPDSFQGDAHSIRIDPVTGEQHGVADWRRDGKAGAAGE